MASHIFKRILHRNGHGNGTRVPQMSNNLSYQLNVRQFHQLTSACRKLRDTVLVLEATKGPLVRTSCALAQTLGTAAMVMGAGTGATYLLARRTSHNHETLKEANLFQHDTNLAAENKETSRRIGLTYFYFANSVLVSSIAGFLSFRLFRNQALLRSLGSRPLVAVGVGVVTPLFLASIVHHLPATVASEGTLVPFGLKETAQVCHAAALGLIAAPLYLLGGQSIIRAGFITAGICAGLHGVAYFTPVNISKNWTTPISCAMHAILGAFLMTLILRRRHAAYKPMYWCMMQGGLLVHSAHYFYMIQAIQNTAKYSTFDPVHASMGLSMDVLNFYARLAFMLPPHFQMCREHPFVTQKDRPNPNPNPNNSNNINERE